MNARFTTVLSSKVLVLLTVTALFLSIAIVARAAIFLEDRRQAISDLREKEASLLTTEEKAILQAASRTGRIACPDGGGTNGTLVRLPDGRDAVISAAHSFVSAGSFKCDLTHAKFYPNLSYYVSGDPSEFMRLGFETDGSMPLNSENPTIMKPDNKSDFLIFIMSTSISSQLMPDTKSPRGYMRFSPSLAAPESVYLIGKNEEFRNNTTPSYENCQAKLFEGGLFHTCATSYSSSSSSIAIMADGELTLLGIHIDEATGSDSIRPWPKTTSEMNGALSIGSVMYYLEINHEMYFSTSDHSYRP